MELAKSSANGNVPLADGDLCPWNGANIVETRGKWMATGWRKGSVDSFGNLSSINKTPDTLHGIDSDNRRMVGVGEGKFGMERRTESLCCGEKCVQTLESCSGRLVCIGEGCSHIVSAFVNDGVEIKVFWERDVIDICEGDEFNRELCGLGTVIADPCFCGIC